MEALQQVKSALAEWQNEILRNTSLVRSRLSQSEARVIEALTSGPTIGAALKADRVLAQGRFKSMIGVIMATSGIKTPPDQMTDGLLLHYFETYLVGFTFGDISLAFMMNAAGELPERVDHFNLLDVGYFSRVMDQYLTEKIRTCRRVQTLLPPAEETAPQTPEQCYRGLVDYVTKNGEFPLIWNYADAYHWMELLGLIPETNDQRWDLFTGEMERLTARLESDYLAGELAGSIMAERETLRSRAQMNCRKALVMKHLPVKPTAIPHESKP